MASNCGNSSRCYNPPSRNTPFIIQHPFIHNSSPVHSSFITRHSQFHIRHSSFRTPLSVARQMNDGWWGMFENKKKPGITRGENRAEWKEEVVPLGVEPRTHGFSVHCSTTWAKVPLWFCGCKGSALNRKQRRNVGKIVCNYILLTKPFAICHDSILGIDKKDW